MVFGISNWSGLSPDFLTAPLPLPLPWRCEKHDTQGEGWCCPMCAIEEAHARAMLLEPCGQIVFGNDWVMVVK